MLIIGWAIRVLQGQQPAALEEDINFVTSIIENKKGGLQWSKINLMKITDNAQSLAFNPLFDLRTPSAMLFESNTIAYIIKMSTLHNIYTNKGICIDNSEAQTHYQKLSFSVITKTSQTHSLTPSLTHGTFSSFKKSNTFY